MAAYQLPTWEELPDLELYMDQVVALVGRYLALLAKDQAEEPVLTPSAVNNYVRMKIMPAPVKKRYSRIHLAYLIAICFLKQSMPMVSIQKVFPMGLEDGQVQSLYTSFAQIFGQTTSQFSQIALTLSGNILQTRPTSAFTENELILSCAVSATLYKLLTEQLLMPPPERADKG
ncbi:MAG: DUF1836 domain-containing protein [Oscillospiraceae bacterium]|nr:DUF1836 domain-containing protein [Oscillospiraceae bacterium]